jgi:hypothetical protein
MSTGHHLEILPKKNQKGQGRVALPQILAYEIEGCFLIGVEQAISC